MYENKYEITEGLWQAITEETKQIVARIEKGENLDPNDVTAVRQLKKEIDQYVSNFQKAMRDAQANYKEQVNQKLSQIGYPVIEAYVAKKRREESDRQNAILRQKGERFESLVQQAKRTCARLQAASYVHQIEAALRERYPKLCSAAEKNTIKNWDQMENSTRQSLLLVESFYASYPEALKLPNQSRTTQDILRYLRTADSKYLCRLKEDLVADQPLLAEIQLKASIKSKADAVERIKQVCDGDKSDAEKLTEIAKLVQLGSALI